MSIRQNYVFLGLSVLLTIITTGQSGRVSLTTQAHRYLKQYGYLPASVHNAPNGGLLNGITSKTAVLDFQSFVGLNATGILDKETMKLISLPRCGVHDKVGLGTGHRTKRYVIQGSLWKEKNLTYRILNYPSTPYMNREDVDAEIARAFSVWSEHSSLTFQRKTIGPADIQIKFATYDHGDDDKFDGPGGTLAHAFFPEFGGEIHFDDSEKWSSHTYYGINLFQTTVHELGHALGLSHSNVNSAIMAPIYRYYQKDFKLDPDDISAIQYLYPKRHIINKTKPCKYSCIS